MIVIFLGLIVDLCWRIFVCDITSCKLCQVNKLSYRKNVYDLCLFLVQKGKCSYLYFS